MSGEKFTMRPTLRAVIAFVALLVLFAAVVPNRSDAQKSTASHLIRIAEESLEVQYHTLVHGDINGALTGRQLVDSYRESRMKRFGEEKQTRDELKRRKLDFKDFTTKLVDPSVEVSGAYATVLAKEQTELAWSSESLTTRLTDTHLFKFENVKGRWTLVGDDIVPPVSSESALLLNDSAFELPLSEAWTRSMRLAHHGSTNPPRKPVFNVYNAGTAGEYARTYATSRNPDYKNFTNDCTNFVSQSLFAGGWTLVGTVDRTNDANWFYACPWISYSWGAAYNQWDFVRNYSNRAIELPVTATDQHPDEARLFEGDLVYCDWNPPGPDGRVDHVTIVTSKLASGDIALSYHTTDTLNISIPLMFDRIHAQGLHVQFRAFRIKDTY
jgi:hypothetical protein